jgi:Raf kinase inhibitor-like YbhB/YbcL family protein
MQLRSDSFEHRGTLASEFTFGRRGDAGEPCVPSANRNPHLAWRDVPQGTHSFALLCVDPDAPSKPDDVNQPGREIASELPRVDFVHWVMVDLDASLRAIDAGACSHGIVAHGKGAPAGPIGSRQGENDYTGWFAGDAAMSGRYLGYDGPCPPFNDARVHRYFFRLFALDVARLELPPHFTAADVLRAAQGHVLAEALALATFTLNPRLQA